MSSVFVETARLKTHLLVSGPEDGIPVVLVHGNVSSSRFYAELMAKLPADIRAVAPDFRGYGHSESMPIDATRGVSDFADDIWAALDALGLGSHTRPVHLVGWSVGGGVVLQMALDRPHGVASLLLEAPMSPFGFGGSRDVADNPCFSDWAGSGGGTANPDFAARLGRQDTSAEADTSPRNILRGFYVKPPFALPTHLEDAYVDAMNTTKVGDGFYPGTLTTSPNWPTVAPGETGMNNAISGKYCNLSAFGDLPAGPPVLWVHGADDQIVSDTSLFDLGFLGQLGAVPGWPGADVFPPQPMKAQMRAVLAAYAAGGGRVREEVLADCGHSPHIEHPAAFLDLLLQHVR